MNHGLASKIGWVALPSHLSLEYPTSDKRNRNPNWTDSEIIRFLTILMEEPVLNDLNAQRNKQVIKRRPHSFHKIFLVVCRCSAM